MDKNRFFPSFFPLYDYQALPVSDEDFKRFHTIDRKLYGKLINILGRDPTESMKVMAFFHWMEGVAKDKSFMAKLYDFTSPLLNKVVDEALICVKCTEDDNFTGYGSPEIFMISNILKRDFTLRFFHENRASAFSGITNSLKTVCFRAFNDIHVVKQPNYFTRASLVPTTNDDIRTVPTINNPSPYAPIGGGGGGIFLESMIPTENKIEELGTLNSSRMMSLMNPSHFLGSATNIEDYARAASRMVPMNPSLVPGTGAGALNIEEFAREATRMIPMNPSRVPGVGASNIEDLARAATRMVPMNPSIVQGTDGEMFLHLPYVVPNQMVQYIPPYHGGSTMNLLPPPLPYNGLHFSHDSSSGSGVFLPQMLPGPYNYHHDIVGAQATQTMNTGLAEMFKNNLNIFDVVKEENEVAPDDRTVFLTFSKGYPISESEVKDFFTRKFGEDVEAVYMQEVPEEEQALYARLVTRSPALLEAIVDGGKAKYNINGKHVWARKYIKKQNPKIMFLGQTSSPVTSTSH
ncbi:uncharacterized protein LOC129892890 [Solanum dulcamara]|uniref:uncharacterized protein LOC129892890 n=1 Tax=Solanum dulcamara TaxID=45834 RepID=UPI002485E446|nr:uncharacterized protein LOC129892890 [Solanum dulcamara]